jgi:hypothetical protein
MTSPTSFVLDSFGDWGFPLKQRNQKFFFMVQLGGGGGGAIREDPSRPIFGFVSFPEGNIPKGANILRFRKDLRRVVPGIVSSGGSPIMESSQIQICFPLPGIQVRAVAKKLCAFKKMEKIREP